MNLVITFEFCRPVLPTPLHLSLFAFLVLSFDQLDFFVFYPLIVLEN